MSFSLHLFIDIPIVFPNKQRKYFCWNQAKLMHILYKPGKSTRNIFKQRGIFFFNLSNLYFHSYAYQKQIFVNLYADKYIRSLPYSNSCCDIFWNFAICWSFPVILITEYCATVYVIYFDIEYHVMDITRPKIYFVLKYYVFNVIFQILNSIPDNKNWFTITLCMCKICNLGDKGNIIVHFIGCEFLREENKCI